MPAREALKLLEQVLQEAEIASYKSDRANYYAALPLWVNATELPEPPAPPQWLLDLIDED